MLSKKSKRYDTDKAFLNSIYNFDNSYINIEKIKSSHSKQFSIRYVTHLEDRDNTCECGVLLINYYFMI